MSTANTTTQASITSSIVPDGRFGNGFFIISASRSVPPVLIPRRNSSPTPSPLSAPPNIEASRALLVYTGSSVVRSMNTDSSSVAMSVIARERGPSSFHAHSSSGTFSIRFHILTRIGVMCASAVDRPDTPPGAMSFGMVNIERLSPTSALPITQYTKSVMASFKVYEPNKRFIGIPPQMNMHLF